MLNLNKSSGLSYETSAFLLIGGVLAFRLLYSALFQTNPAGDEAYYWDWGRQLDCGYYSKPPFIAWLYAFVDWVGNGSLFGIRAMSAILSAASTVVIFLFTREIFDSRTGWIAVVLSVAIPANAVLSFFLTIDAPLVLCWATALWMFWRCLRGEGKAGSYLLLFLALAIGHLTKQMMMIFPVLAVIYVSLHRDTRPLFRKKAVWITMALSYLALLPPLFWNAKNDWITFEHTGHHFESGGGDKNVFVERIGEFLSFVGTQLGAVSPLVAVALYGLCFTGLFRLKSIPTPYRFLAVFSAFPLSLIVLLSLRQTIQPNWPAVFYIAGVVLVAGWFSGIIKTDFKDSFRRRYFKNAIAIGIALASFFYVGPVVFKLIGKDGNKADPTRRMLGYDKVCEKFDELREQTQHDFMVSTGHRDYVSQLAFGLHDQPRVYQWEKRPGIHSQYQLWNNPAQDGFVGKNALILVPTGGVVHKPLRKAFDSVEKVDDFDAVFGYNRERSFSVWRGIGLKEWPKLPEEQPAH